jgi:hypothetical protein
MNKALSSKPPRPAPAAPQDRYVFPLNLGVVKLSGSGNDTLFLGVARPVEEDKRVIKVSGRAGRQKQRGPMGAGRRLSG